MDVLQTFIHLLWVRLNLLLRRRIVVNEKNYLLSDQASKISNLKESIKTMEDLNRLAFEIPGDIETFIEKELEKYLREDLLKKKQIVVPKNFEEFTNKQIPRWIENAIRALINRQDQQYVVQEGLIKPVAYDSTGVIRDATSWGDGLHQLIQRKHGLKMTSETCTTNFLSNIGYIMKYKTNLFGLTGTLGSSKAQEILSKIYKVDLVMIPSLHKKRYLQLATTICQNQSEWLKEICESALREANKERGTLIICQTIEDCKLIRYELAKKYRSGAIKLYMMNNMNQERDIDQINPGEIIVATNLAGRGTDIKTEKIENNGGLHVIVSFLPPNQRVEDQAFGRTARQGKRGTGQMILDRTLLSIYGDVSSEKLKDTRDTFESQMFDEFMRKDYEMVKIKDQLFEKFCVLKKNICQEIKNPSNSLQKPSYLGSSIFETGMLNALEERWALFLHEIDSDNAENQIIRTKEINEKYNSFENQIKKDFRKDELIKNPYYHIKIANDLLAYDSLSRVKGYFISFVTNQNETADYHFDKAARIDSNVIAATFVGKTWSAIKSHKKGCQEKSKWIQELTKSLKPLHDEMAVLNTLQTFVQEEHSSLDCDLSKQLNQKASILGSFVNSIQQAVTAIKRSQRLIDITAIEFFEKDASSIKNVDTVKRSSNFYDLERNEETKAIKKETIEKLGNYHRFTVAFNDLTVSSDTGYKDQATETISEVFYSHNNTSDTKLKSIIEKTKNLLKNSPALDPLKYKDLALISKGLNTEELKILFDPDVQIRDASKDFALAELQKQSKNCLVNLEIIVDGKEQESRTNERAEDAIAILKNREKEHERFNILFQNVNKTAKSLRKQTLNDFILTLEYPNLSSETAMHKLDKIKSDSLHIEISGHKTEILKVLSYAQIKTIKLISEDNEIETASPNEAKERILKIAENREVNIKIEELAPEIAKQIIPACSSANFKFTFIGVKAAPVPGGSEGDSANISFSKLSPPVATNLIPILRKANLDFTLAFNNLEEKHLKGVIEKASLEKEKIEITTVKKLSDLFMEKTRPNLELAEFAARGIEYILEINEKRFIPWRSIYILAFVGALQMVAGFLLLPTVFGSTYGMALITESLTEGFMITKAYNNRHFRWSDYLKHKAISLVVSAVSLGFTKMQDGFKGASNALRGVKTEAIEQAASEVVMNSQAIGGALMHAGKEFKKFSIGQFVTTTSNQAVVEVSKKAFQAADLIFDFSLEKFKPDISFFIQEKVESIFYVGNFKAIIQKMHALDKIKNSKSLLNQMNKITCDLVNPEKRWCGELWDSIGMGLCKTILWNPAALQLQLTLGMKIIGALHGLKDVISLLESIQNRFVHKLSEIDKETLLIHQLLHQHCKLSLEDAVEVSKILKAEGAILKNFDCEEINPEIFAIQSNQEKSEEDKGTKLERNYNQAKVLKSAKNIDFGNYGKHKDAVLKFCEDFSKYSVTLDKRIDLSEIMKAISDIITEHIIRVAESHLICPGKGLNIRAPSSDIQAQNKIVGDFGINCFQDLGEQLQNGQFDNRSAEQPNQENRPNENQLVIEKMGNYAQQILNSKPADLADLFGLASLYEIEIKIVEDIAYILTEKEKQQAIKIILYTSGEKDEKGDGAGYYKLLNAKRLNGGSPRKETGCGFAVILAILKERGIKLSTSELRRQLAKKIQQDPINYNKLIEAQDWVKNSNPKEIRERIADPQVLNSSKVIVIDSIQNNSGLVVVPNSAQSKRIILSENDHRVGERILQEVAQEEMKDSDHKEIQKAELEEKKKSALGKEKEKSNLKQIALKEKSWSEIYRDNHIYLFLFIIIALYFYMKK